MANLGNDDLEEEVMEEMMEEVDADHVLEDFEYLPVKTEFLGATHAHPRFEKYANFPGLVKLKKDIGLSDVVKQYVLPFLPAKSLCRFKAVSKEWNQWISNPFLAHLQTTHFKDISGLLCQSPGLDPSFISFNQDAYGIPTPSLEFLPELVNIRTTCNGLFCCQSVFEFGYYICNPVTKEWHVLPEPNFFHGPETAVALVFEPTTLSFSAHYELVCAVPVNQNYVSIFFFEIYSSRSKSWRTAETICSEPEVLKLSINGFYMEGFVYWTSVSGAILVFDFKDEQYGILPLPAGSGPHGALTQMHGELCYMLPQVQDGECLIGVYGNLDMSLKCVIPIKPEVLGETFSDCRVLTCVNSDILIILLPNKVIAYHVKAQKMQVVSKVGTEGFQNCLPYINSLAAVAWHPTANLNG